MKNVCILYVYIHAYLYIYIYNNNIFYNNKYISISLTIIITFFFNNCENLKDVHYFLEDTTLAH